MADRRSIRSLGLTIGLVVLAAVAVLGWLLWPRAEMSPSVAEATPSLAAAEIPASAQDGSGRLAAAVTVVFPRGAAAQDENGERYTFETHRLIDTAFGPVLLSEGKAVDPAHVSAGRIDVAYLRADGQGFAMVKNYPAAIEIGSFGEMSDWSVSGDYADVQTVTAEGGFSGQGYTCGAVVLTELRPEGPAEVATVRTIYDNSGAAIDGDSPVTIEGKIVNIRKGAGFDVRYAGTRSFTDHWVRRGGKYVLQGKSQLPEC